MKAQTFIFGSLFTWIAAFSVFAQSSDHARVDSFITQYELIEQQSKLAISSAQISMLRNDLDSLFEMYEKDENLIDHAVYPSSFNEMMSKIDTELASGKERLLVIENQKEALLALNNQVESFIEEISFLNSKTDSLRTEIAKSMASEERLSGMVRSYRMELEKRDALVFELIDSLLITYQGLNTTNGSELAQSLGSASENPLTWVMTLIEENIGNTQTQHGYLNVEDYLRMYALERSFEQAWDQVGENMITVYGGKNSEQWKAQFSDKIKEWRMLSAHNMWRSIDQYLDVNDIQLAAFDNKHSFYAGLEAFLDQGISESEKEILTSNSYQDYLKLKKFWNTTFKNEWTDDLKDASILTVAQVENIDRKLNRWEQEARPIHPMLVAIVALLIVSIAGFILVMFRSGTVRYK